MDKHGEEMIHLFESRNDRWRELLTNVTLRPAPDKTFDKDLKLDLGGGADPPAALVRRCPYQRR